MHAPEVNPLTPVLQPTLDTFDVDVALVVPRVATGLTTEKARAGAYFALAHVEAAGCADTTRGVPETTLTFVLRMVLPAQREVSTAVMLTPNRGGQDEVTLRHCTTKLVPDTTAHSGLQEHVDKYAAQQQSCHSSVYMHCRDVHEQHASDLHITSAT